MAQIEKVTNLVSGFFENPGYDQFFVGRVLFQTVNGQSGDTRLGIRLAENKIVIRAIKVNIDDSENLIGGAFGNRSQFFEYLRR